jgi:hypothetical protein
MEGRGASFGFAPRFRAAPAGSLRLAVSFHSARVSGSLGAKLCIERGGLLTAKQRRSEGRDVCCAGGHGGESAGLRDAGVQRGAELR